MTPDLFHSKFLMVVARVAIVTLVFSCCTSKREVVSRETLEAIIAERIEARSVSEAERGREYFRELVVMEADTAGVLRPVSRVVERVEERQTEKRLDSVVSVDSAAFLTEANKEHSVVVEKPKEAGKTAFWRNVCVFFAIIAAVCILFVYLFNSTIKKWI